jgi:hypothetical protein
MAGQAEKKRPVRIPPLVIAAGVLAAIGCRNIFGGGEVAHAYAVLEIVAALGLLSAFLWQEMKQVFPAEQFRVRKAYLAGLIALSIFFVPLAALLLPWQFFELYRAHKALPGSDANRRVLYAAAALMAFAGGGCVTYLQVTNPVGRPAEQHSPAPEDTVAPPIERAAPAAEAPEDSAPVTLKVR